MFFIAIPAPEITIKSGIDMKFSSFSVKIGRIDFDKKLLIFIECVIDNEAPLF